MRVIGRFAESKDPVLYASYGEVDKCEFIKVNAPKEAWEAWSSTDDDGAGLLVKAGALREQAREALVRAARFRTSMSMCGPSACCYPRPPARSPQGQGMRLVAMKEPAAKKEPAAMKESAAMKEPAAAVKKETLQASCRRVPPHPPPLLLYQLTTNLLWID